MSRIDDLHEHLARLNRIGIALSSERDLRGLLRRILEEARLFTGAEAGTLYTVEGRTLRFVVSQNEVLPGRGGSDDSSVWFEDRRLPLSPDSMAGYVGLTGEVINLEDAYHIPAGRSYRFNAEFDRSVGYRSRSMLLVPMQEPGGRTMGVLQLINARGVDGGVVPFDPRFEELVRSLASQAAVAIRNVRLTEELKRAYHETILRLAVAVEFRDDDTAEHIRRMAEYAVLIAKELGRDAEEVDLLRYAAPMHDVGKVGVPDAILCKPGRLTADEFDQMKRHTLIGAQILGDSEAPVLRVSAQIARSHHEKFDGTGYPDGLSGQQIPLMGRITALADVFDALSSERCYKPAFPMDRCLAIVREQRGRQFDPEVVDAFLRRTGEVGGIRAGRASGLPGLGSVMTV